MQKKLRDERRADLKPAFNYLKVQLPSRQQRGCASHTDRKIPLGLFHSQLQWINLLVGAKYMIFF